MCSSDLIIDSWKNAKNPLLESIDTVVCSVLEQYYQEAVSAGIQEVGELPWLALTELYKVRYPEKIPSMMEHLRVGVLKNVSPQTAWDFLSAFINATQDNLPAYLSTYYEILNICFEFELYDEGLCSPIVNAISHLAEREPDKHIVALAYYDLFLYYTAILQPENARYYKERAYKLRQWAPTIRARMEKKFSWDSSETRSPVLNKSSSTTISLSTSR